MFQLRVDTFVHTWDLNRASFCNGVEFAIFDANSESLPLFETNGVGAISSVCAYSMMFLAIILSNSGFTSFRVSGRARYRAEFTGAMSALRRSM